MTSLARVFSRFPLAKISCYFLALSYLFCLILFVCKLMMV